MLVLGYIYIHTHIQIHMYMTVYNCVVGSLTLQLPNGRTLCVMRHGSITRQADRNVIAI